MKLSIKKVKNTSLIGKIYLGDCTQKGNEFLYSDFVLGRLDRVG